MFRGKNSSEGSIISDSSYTWLARYIGIYK